MSKEEVERELLSSIKKLRLTPKSVDKDGAAKFLKEKIHGKLRLRICSMNAEDFTDEEY